MRLFIPAGMTLAVLLIVQAKGCGVCFRLRLQAGQ
jgi:hypothetical protein